MTDGTSLKESPSPAPAALFHALARCVIDLAPRTNIFRVSLLPAFVIRPRRPFPPAECWRGVSPSQAAKWRALRKFLVPSPTVAAISDAVIGPTPGIVASRRAASFAFDAETLAQLVRTGWYSRSPGQGDLSNQIRSTLKTFGLRANGGAGHVFEAKVRASLEGRPEVANVVEPLLAVWRAIRNQIAVLDRAAGLDGCLKPAADLRPAAGPTRMFPLPVTIRSLQNASIGG